MGKTFAEQLVPGWALVVPLDMGTEMATGVSAKPRPLCGPSKPVITMGIPAKPRSRSLLWAPAATPSSEPSRPGGASRGTGKPRHVTVSPPAKQHISLPLLGQHPGRAGSALLLCQHLEEKGGKQSFLSSPGNVDVPKTNRSSVSSLKGCCKSGWLPKGDKNDCCSGTRAEVCWKCHPHAASPKSRVYENTTFISGLAGRCLAQVPIRGQIHPNCHFQPSLSHLLIDSCQSPLVEAVYALETRFLPSLSFLVALVIPEEGSPRTIPRYHSLSHCA